MGTITAKHYQQGYRDAMEEIAAQIMLGRGLDGVIEWVESNGDDKARQHLAAHRAIAQGAPKVGA